MAELETAMIGIFSAVSIAVVGYVLNGWRERSFERRKINYSKKLELFKGVNNTCDKIFMIYDDILTLGFDKMIEPEKAKASELLYIMDFIPELGIPEKMNLYLNEIMKFVNKSSTSPSIDLDAEGAKLFSLKVIPTLMNALSFHMNALNRSTNDLVLICDTFVVPSYSAKISEYLMGQFAMMRNQFFGIEIENPNPPKLSTDSTDLEILIKKFSLAMRFELKATMLSWVGLKSEETEFRRTIQWIDKEITKGDYRSDASDYILETLATMER